MYWALRFCTPETAPLQYAGVQHNLGVAYYDLPIGDRSANLERAIACYHEALRFCTPETAPFDYASTQNSLGNAYSNLPTGDRSANLEQAITCFQEALRFRTAEAAPLDYADTQHNLGTVYRSLPTGDQTANLERAIACYQEALRFRTPEAAPFYYAQTQNSLGNAYSQLPTGDQISNLERAIACYEQALRFHTPEAAPLEYAIVQLNLGNAYSDLLSGDRTANLERAIACYQEALRFCTPETAPFDYAGTQYSLGNTFRDLPTGDRIANLERAISCYQEALRFWTPETAPSQSLIANRALADLYFAQGEWESALVAYRAAMEAVEQLYYADLTTESKANEVADNIELYHFAAFAGVRCGKAAEALLIMEQGKTRLLAEALRLRVSRPTFVPDNVWRGFEAACASVRAAQVGKVTELNEERDKVQLYTARVKAAREASSALNAAIEGVRHYAPKFLLEIDLPTIQTLLLDKHTVLMTFCITKQGSIGFLVHHNVDQGVQVVEVPNFTKADLDRLIIDWLEAYAHHQFENTQTAFVKWQETITNTLAELSQVFLTPILAALPSNVEKIILLPSADLFLLPLHAAPLAGSNSDQVCDRYQVSYAPSLKVLVDIMARTKRDAAPELYAVINPEADPQLVFTPAEGKAIAQFFKISIVDERGIGTKQRVLSEMKGKSYVHFSCHGSYNWNNPPTSGLALADDRLTLTELQQGVVDLSSARLVTLSACETGITDILEGSAEEYVGIPAGFLLAGVPCVVSSLWAVPELSTALLMERLYRNHLTGEMDIAAALREGQVWVRRLSGKEVVQYIEQVYQHAHGKDKNRLFGYLRHYRYLAERNPAWRPFEHPYYWAAFTANGL